MKFPILYSYDQKRFWSIENIGEYVYRESGLVDGKVVKFQRKFEGKNIGKKNESTPEEQALFNAQKEWAKYLDKGYKPLETDIEGMKMYNEIMKQKAKFGGKNYAITDKAKGKIFKEENTSNEIIKYENIRPIACQKWETTDKCQKYFQDNIIIQPKYDGNRAVARLNEKGDVVITSRNNKVIRFLYKLKENLKQILTKDMILDGELYSHILYDENNKEVPQADRFSLLSSIINQRNKPHQLEDQIKFVVRF